MSSTELRNLVSPLARIAEYEDGIGDLGDNPQGIDVVVQMLISSKAATSSERITISGQTTAS